RLRSTPMGWRCRLCAPFRPGAPCPFYDRSLWDRSWVDLHVMCVVKTTRKATPAFPLMELSAAVQLCACWGSMGEGALTASFRSSLFVVVAEDQLRLRHNRSELAVTASDARLQHDSGAAAMQRHAHRMRSISLRHSGEEVGLALNRRGSAAVG